MTTSRVWDRLQAVHHDAWLFAAVASLSLLLAGIAFIAGLDVLGFAGMVTAWLGATTSVGLRALAAGSARPLQLFAYAFLAFSFLTLAAFGIGLFFLPLALCVLLAEPQVE